jgi:phosphotriesterase-related protein
MGQIEMLTGLGVPPDRIALSHTDKIDDIGYHRSLLETGVFLCYDQGIRHAERTFSLVESMVEEGFETQIVLGTDGHGGLCGRPSEANRTWPLFTTGPGIV